METTMPTIAVVAMLLLSMALLWAMQGLGRGASSRFTGGSRRKARAEAHKHFVAAAQLLARARSAKSKGRSLAREAVQECDVAISLDPRDAAAYIVKALALEHMGQSTAALRALSTALSPPASKTLSQSEKADALLKRAAMILSNSKGKRASKAAIEDLESCVALNPQNAAKAYGLLASCYETLGMESEARRCRDKLSDFDPDEHTARDLVH